MKAAITDGKGGLEIRETPMPEIGEYDCLVKTESCAFCNSTDRHITESTVAMGGPYPAILGHESVGVVEKCGPKVRHLAPGDRVLRPMAAYPDETLGGFGSLWGGFAEYAKARDGRAMVEDGVVDAIPHCHGYQQVVPPDIPLDETLVMTCQREIWSVVAGLRRVDGRRFLVTGAGIAACLFGLFLKKRGAEEVTMAARRREPLQYALSNGWADKILASDDTALEGDFDALVETTGNAEFASELLTICAPESPVYSYAVYGGADKALVAELLGGPSRYVRVNPKEASAHKDVCRMIQAGELTAAPFVTFRFPFSRLKEAWATVLEKRTLKTVVMFA